MKKGALANARAPRWYVEGGRLASLIYCFLMAIVLPMAVT